MHKDFIIGIDTGTSVVKAVLADLQGVELASATENTPVENPYENWSEYDLVTDWNRVVRAIRKLLSKTRIDPGDILAIAVTGKGWGCCYLPVWIYRWYWGSSSTFSSVPLPRPRFKISERLCLMSCCAIGR